MGKLRLIVAYGVLALWAAWLTWNVTVPLWAWIADQVSVATMNFSRAPHNATWENPQHIEGHDQSHIEAIQRHRIAELHTLQTQDLPYRDGSYSIDIQGDSDGYETAHTPEHSVPLIIGPSSLPIGCYADQGCFRVTPDPDELEDRAASG